MRERFDVTPDRKSVFSSIKKELIRDLKKEINTPNVSAEYKKARTHYVVQEVAEINRALGLKETDGVEKWTSNKDTSMKK